ncbi:MAG: cell wall anchor protein, partial [Lactococcus lactis]
QGVRYDLFGSALQAHLTTQVRDIVYLNYYDANENNQLIVPQHQFIWFPNVSWNVPASKFPHYAYGQESQHRNGNTIIVGDYYHIQSTVTYDYYGMDGIYLGQESTTGLYNKPYSVNVPYNFGNYYIEGSTTESGLYPKTDETLDVYYKYVPPIVYYNTSNPYATTYYANGYEYVPNYIAPVVYYAPTYGYYGGGTSYSGDYGYSSGGGYSNSNGTYYPNYVPQSAYYSKEAQLVAEERGYGGELPGGGDSDNWLEGELGSQSIGISGAIGWAKYGPELAGASDFAGGIGGGFLTAGVELATGHDANDAMAKGFANAGITLAVGTLVTGAIAVAAPVAVAVGVGLAVSAALSFGYDWLYDHRKRRG